MGSSLLTEARRRGRAEGHSEGHSEGRAEGEVIVRSLCAEFVRQYHPAILPVVAPVIEACADAGRLHAWALAAPRVSDAEFVSLVKPEAPGGPSRTSGSRSSRGRAPRPSRRAKPASRR